MGSFFFLRCCCPARKHAGMSLFPRIPPQLGPAREAQKPSLTRYRIDASTQQSGASMNIRAEPQEPMRKSEQKTTLAELL